MVPKSALILSSKSALILGSKSALVKDPKGIKSSLIKKPLHTYKPFLFIVTTKSALKIKMVWKIKSKFAAGQLKTANLATFAVKILKRI